MSFYLCNIDDDVTRGVDNKEEMIEVGQSVCPGGPVSDVSKPKHLKENIKTNFLRMCLNYLAPDKPRRC